MGNHGYIYKRFPQLKLVLKNLMIFRKCTIGGNAYRGDIVEPSSHDDDDDDDENEPTMSIVEVPAAINEKKTLPSGGDSSADTTRVQDEELLEPRATDAALEKFTDLALQLDIAEAIRNQKNNTTTTTSSSSSSSSSDFSTTLVGFFTVLSLCHSVIAAKDPITGKVLEYRAQSPDEAALVKAAAEMGFEFLGKDKDILSLKIPGSAPDNIERYELLDILDFTSARKRMSVVLRKLNPSLSSSSSSPPPQDGGSLLLLTKGADNIIFERLRAGADEMKMETEKHLSEFANSGLRTLTLAYKTIEGSFFFHYIEKKSRFSDFFLDKIY